MPKQTMAKFSFETETSLSEVRATQHLTNNHILEDWKKRTKINQSYCSNIQETNATSCMLREVQKQPQTTRSQPKTAGNQWQLAKNHLLIISN